MPTLIGPPRGSLYLLGATTKVRKSSGIWSLRVAATKKDGNAPLSSLAAFFRCWKPGSPITSGALMKSWDFWSGRKY